MVLWSELYKQDNQPDLDNIDRFVNIVYWNKLNALLQKDYNVLPKVEYSRCYAQRGWNIKYKKGRKSLCTLYPMENYFIALVVINIKMQTDTELVIAGCSNYIQDLFWKTPSSCGGKWLMIEVRNKETYEDLIKLIKIRAKLG